MTSKEQDHAPRSPDSRFKSAIRIARLGLVVLLEHVFFGLSIWMLIPPMPSVPYEKPPVIRLKAGITIISMMAISRLCAYVLSRESLAGILLKMLVMWAAIWIFNEWCELAFLDLLNGWQHQD